MDIQARIDHIKAMREEIKEVVPGTDFKTSKGDIIHISPIPAIKSVDFFEVLGMLFDIAKNKKMLLNKETIAQNLMSISFDLVLVMIEMVIGDNIKNLTIEDAVSIVEIIIKQNYTKTVEKKIQPLIQKLMTALIPPLQNTD